MTTFQFRRVHAGILAVMMIGLLLPGDAQAKNLKGRLGIGLEQTLGGVTGITLRYWPGQAFGLTLTVGGELTSFTAATTPTTTPPADNADPAPAVVGVQTETEEQLASTVKASLGFTYNISRSLHANLGIGARLALGFRSQPALQLEEVTAVDSLQFSLEIPLTVEFFFSENFSASLSLGFLFAFIPETGAVLEAPDQGNVQNASLLVKIGGSAVGSLGLVYYF